MSENLPVSWQEQMKAQAQSLLERERPAVSTVSFKSGVMKIGEEPVPNNEIDVIIVANATEQCWYSTRYNPDVFTIPDCYALGVDRAENLSPHEEAKNPQSVSCAGCEKFGWGSDPNGGRGKACKERRRLAMIPANGAANICLTSIPPTSIKGWSAYVRRIFAATGLTPASVITKVKVIPSSKNQFEVTFTEVGPVPDEHMPQVMAQGNEALRLLLQPYREPEEEAKPTGKKAKY